MLIVVVLVIVTMAELVSDAVGTALDGVYKVVLPEQGERTEDVRLVDGLDPSFQLSQRLGLHRTRQSSRYHNPVGRRLHTMLFEQTNIRLFVHSDVIF